jgi:hypothetical protein
VFCPSSYLRDSWSQLDFFIVMASIVDMAFAGVEIRFISHNKNMKIVVNALMESVTAILNVSVVIGMIWIMFGILAISFLKDEMGYCDGIGGFYGVSITSCADKGGTWKTWPWNFDN